MCTHKKQQFFRENLQSSAPSTSEGYLAVATSARARQLIAGWHGPPLTPRKSAFFQERGRKRMKEWREVTFHEIVDESLDDTRILVPADLTNLFSFPRYSRLNLELLFDQISLCKIWPVFNWL